MNLPRPTRTTLIFSLCLAALASALAYEYHQLSLVTNNLAATADKDSLNALLSRLATIDERLDTVDGKHLVTNDDFRSGQQALSIASMPFRRMPSKQLKPPKHFPCA